MAVPNGNSPHEYADWINHWIGVEVRVRREARRSNAFALAKACGVSDPAIRNIERGVCKNGALVKTLARIVVCFDLSLPKLIRAAECRGKKAAQQRRKRYGDGPEVTQRIEF